MSGAKQACLVPNRLVRCKTGLSGAKQGGTAYPGGYRERGSLV
ncbi:hypothetical protein [Echinicola soli]|nr:hypothetical protein [Echinicola soli]